MIRMEQTHNTRWEQSLAQLAQRFEYPPTPAIIDSARGRGLTADGRPPTAESPSGGRRPTAVGRRLAWSLAVLIVIALALLAAPSTRAAILSFFARVGAIDIFIDEAAPTAVPSTAVPAPTALPATTEASTASHSLSLLDLGQPTTAAEAARQVGFTLRLPAALGQPDEVYLHRGVDLPAVTLVWRGPDGAPLSLTQIGVAEFARKMVGLGGAQETAVNGAPAMWLPGPHTLLLLGDWQPNAIPITSNVLIWVGDGFTYRLEGDLTMEEAVVIAQSMDE